MGHLRPYRRSVHRFKGLPWVPKRRRALAAWLAKLVDRRRREARGRLSKKD